MTRQEKVREGLANMLYEVFGGDSDFNREAGYYPCADLADEQAEQVLTYLHSQGAVIKVDRELPKKTDVRLYGSGNEEYEAGYSNGFSRCRFEAEKAGYVAVEPLIEEAKE